MLHRVFTWSAGSSVAVRVFLKDGESRTAATDVFELQLSRQSQTWAVVRKMAFDFLSRHTSVRVDEASKLKLYSVTKKT